MRRRRLLQHVTAAQLAAVLFTAAFASEADGQTSAEDPRHRTFGGHVGVLSANALAGAITGGVHALVAGEDVPRAISRGIIGGGIVYLGKEIASTDRDGSVLAGRLIAGVGGDVIASSAWAGPLFQRVDVSVGPFRIRLRGANGHSRVRVNVLSSILLVRAATTAGLTVDWRRSLEAATPVFVTDRSVLFEDGERINGFTTHGLIVLQDRLSTGMTATFRHEAVHLIQFDFMEKTWDYPLEMSLRERWAWAAAVPGWTQAGILVPGILSTFRLFGNDERGLRALMQEEAEWFENR